jgi:GcvH upstream region-like protein
MLNFFRKHQRFFFIFITAVIILSFSFFGNFGFLSSVPKKENRLLCHNIYGKPIYENQVQLLCHFLGGDHHSLEHRHYLDDGVFERDFLMTGLGAMLAENYFDVIASELKERVEKAKKYTPYTHPSVPFFKAEMIWNSYAPVINEQLKNLQTHGEAVAPEDFSTFSELYLAQMRIPPAALKQILSYQQNRYTWIKADPNLEQADLSLFGFHSPADWFGPKYMELIAQIILNGAAEAQARGYLVTNEEAKAHLLQNVYNFLSQGKKDLNLTYPEIDEHLQNHIKMLGIDQGQAIDLWKTVMLFCRLFDDVGGGALVDRYAYEQLASYAGEGVEFEVYQLPDPLRLANFWDMLKLEYYLQTVSTGSPRMQNEALNISKIARDVNEVERKRPEFVQKRFSIEYARVDKNSLNNRLSLKEIWDWELEEEHFKKLKANFGELVSADSSNKEKRYDALEGLKSEDRARVDAFAQSEMINEHPEWIEEALTLAPTQKQVVKIRMKDASVPFPGVEDPMEFLSLLEKAPLDGETRNTSLKNPLDLYTPDEINYFRIKVIKKADQNEIISFEEAKQGDLLDRLLTESLQSNYPDICKQKPELFLDDNGEWKPFDAVKEHVGALVYANLLHAIEEDYKNTMGSLPPFETPEKSYAFYAERRLFNYVRELRKAIEADPENAAWVRADQRLNEEVDLGLERFKNQWKLVKNSRKVTRCEANFSQFASLFESKLGNFLSVDIGPRGDIHFYRPINHFINDDFVAQKIHDGQQLLSNDAKRHLMKQLLKQINDKKAIKL